MTPISNGPGAEDRHALFDLSSNTNLLGSSPEALKAARAQIATLSEYRYRSDELLRKKLAAHYSLSENQFLAANGSLELVDMIGRAFIKPGDECILPSPTSLIYTDYTRLAGATIVHAPLDPRYFEPDITGILTKVNENTRLIFLASPNNPTGSIITRPQLDKLISALPPRVILVCDEAYHQYITEPLSARAPDYIKLGFPIIALHSFSAAYGLAGLRLAYALSTDALIRRLRRWQRPFMINSVSAAAAIAALGDQAFVDQTVRSTTREKSWCYDALADLGLRFWTSHANFILFRAPGETHILANQLLKKGILVRVGEPFGADGCIRITVGPRRANKAFIRALADILHPATKPR
jgi:histidinol-phosphate aminotransferase